MNYEQNTTNSQEYFETAHTLGEVMSQYKMLTQLAVIDHEARCANILSAHETVFIDELNTPGSQSIDYVMMDTRARVYGSVEPVVGQVDGLLSAAAEIIPSMLDARSQQILLAAKSEAAEFGIDSRYVTEALNKAPRDVRPALKAALDANVLAKVKSEAATFDVDFRYVKEAVNGASSAYVRAAMLASLDSSVFDKVQSGKSTFGIVSRYVSDALNNASTPTIKAAMKAALDVDVLTEAKTQASLLGIDSRYVKDVLNHASSKTVRAVLERQFVVPQASNKRTGYEQNNRSRFDSIFEDDLKEYFQYFRAGDDKHQGYPFGYSDYDYQQPREQPRQPRPEASMQKPERDVEIDNIVSRTVTRNKQYSWLQDVPQQDIRRVINTVQKLREKAKANGKTMSDGKVYRKYRYKAETTPKLTKSVQILEALMNGDFNGQLPF